MKAKITLLAPALLALLMLNLQPLAVRAQGTAFTYQGRLTDSGQCANGLYNFMFTLYSDPYGMNLVANNKNSTTSILVTNGLFTVTNLDFGTSPFVPGQSLWLQIQVCTNTTTSYETVTPLQQLTPTPYAISAENFSGSISASQLTGSLSSNALTGNYVNEVNFSNPDNNFVGTGYGLTDVNAATVGGLPASDFWQLTGNAGTTPGINFVGTTDNEPLQLWANGSRAFLLDGSANAAQPSIVGGGSQNSVGGGNPGSTIAGGWQNTISGPTFRDSAQGSTIGGGYQNTIQANLSYSTIAGGQTNTVQANCSWAVISGGLQNTIQTGAHLANIGGGYSNTVEGFSEYATISGGNGNTIESESADASIGGGTDNQIWTNSSDCSISGGAGNTVETSNLASAIAGGSGNIIGEGTDNGFIGGGYNNFVSTGASMSTIGGGTGNAVYANATDATISGGTGNTIYLSGSTVSGGTANSILSLDSTISGGSDNQIGGSSAHANIAGGTQNIIEDNSSYSSIVGGGFNKIQTGNSASSIAGGSANTIGGNDFNAFIGGGYQNTVGGSLAHSTIGGGNLNNISSGASFATIPGGWNNTVSGSGSFAAGEYATAMTSNSFVWGDGNGPTASSTNDQFIVRASGGTVFLSSAATPNATITFGGSVTPGDYVVFGINGCSYVGAFFCEASYPFAYYNVTASDSIDSLAANLAQEINSQLGPYGISATAVANQINLTSQTSWLNMSLIAQSLTSFYSQTPTAGSEDLILSGPTYPTGVQLLAGSGSWNSLSDRNAKENFQAIDAQSVLAEVAAMPVNTWNYKTQDKAIRHIGPVAQDFHALFGVGENETSISTVDEGGVALAAIQGLNQKETGDVDALRQELQRRVAENADLRANVTGLQQQVDELRRAITALTGKSGGSLASDHSRKN